MQQSPRISSSFIRTLAGSAGFFATWFALASLTFLVAACEAGQGRPVGVVGSNLTQAQRQARLSLIRDGASEKCVSNALPLAGIAQQETGLAHCWSEATWACKGPNAADCGNGPVIAGAGDGACSLMQGGLGMFQFDGGTYTQTLARDGRGILTVTGNAARAVDFVVDMLVRSAYFEIDTRDEAIQWLNDFDTNGPDRADWIRTVVRYYNGCAPTSSCWTQRNTAYNNALRIVEDETSTSFWQSTLPESCGGPIQEDSGSAQDSGVDSQVPSDSSTPRDAARDSQVQVRDTSTGDGSSEASVAPPLSQGCACRMQNIIAKRPTNEAFALLFAALVAMRRAARRARHGHRKTITPSPS